MSIVDMITRELQKDQPRQDGFYQQIQGFKKLKEDLLHSGVRYEDNRYESSLMCRIGYRSGRDM